MAVKIRRFIIDILVILFGSAVYGLGVHVFTASNNIAPGGVTGISTVINHLTGFPLGTTYLFINIPLLVLAFIYLNRNFLVKTIISILFFTFGIDVFYAKIPVYTGDKLLACLFGGVLIGAGLAVTFMRDGSTGGTDITNRIIQKKMPHIKMGQIVFVVDIAIVAFAAISFKSLESGLYATVVMAVSSVVMDNIMYGFDKGKVLMIITDRAAAISKRINEELKRGCTLLDATGAYTGERRNVIICAVHRNEFYKLRKTVYDIDSSAFVMITEAGEVFGEGFKSNAKD